MKIELNKFRESLKKAMSGVEAKKGVGDSNAFTFKDGFVHSFRDMIAVSVFLSDELKDLSGTIKAAEFFKLISKLDETEIIIEQGEKDIQIQSGRAQASFSLLEDSSAIYTANMNMDELKWLPASPDFLDGLNYCKLNCQSDYMISGIRVLGRKMVSTDGKRINCFDLKESMGDWLLEDAAAFELIKLNEIVQYAVSDSRIFFTLPDDSVISCRKRMADNYPMERLQAVLEKFSYKDGYFKGTLPSKFKNMLDRAVVLSVSETGIPIVELRLTKKGIEAVAQKDIGRFKEMLDWENVDEDSLRNLTKDIVIFIDVSIALYGLKRSSDFYVLQEESGDIKVVFVGDNCRCLVATCIKNKNK